MIRSILVGLDGSDFCWHALEYAVSLSLHTKALVAGAAVVDRDYLLRPEPVPLGGASFKGDRDQAIVAAAEQRANQILDQFIQTCTKHEVPSKPLLLEGNPGEAIVEHAQRYDLVVMGKESMFHAPQQTTSCGTLRTVLKGTPRPVVVVPPKPGSGNSVLIAYDGSLPSAHAIQMFMLSGLHVGRELHVLTIDSDQTRGAKIADHATEFLGFHHVKAKRHLVPPRGNIGSTILEVGNDLGAGMVVLGSYGKSAITEFFLGSMTRYFLDHSKVPLFLYH